MRRLCLRMPCALVAIPAALALVTAATWAGGGYAVAAAGQREPQVRRDVECQLRLKHLKAKPGLRVVRTRDHFLGNFPITGYQRDGKSVVLGPALFEEVATPQQARELAELCLEGAFLVKTAGQYQELVNHFRGDFRFKVHADKAKTYGLTVEKMAGGGFEVRVLYYGPYHGGLIPGGSVRVARLTITADGVKRAIDEPLLTNGYDDGRARMPGMAAGEGEGWNTAARNILQRQGGLQILGSGLIVPKA